MSRKKAAALQQEEEKDMEALQKIEHTKEKKRMLSLTPLHYQINKVIGSDLGRGNLIM